MCHFFGFGWALTKPSRLNSIVPISKCLVVFIRSGEVPLGMPESAVIELFRSQDPELWRAAKEEVVEHILSYWFVQSPYGYVVSVLTWVVSLVLITGVPMMVSAAGGPGTVVGDTITGPLLLGAMIISVLVNGITALNAPHNHMKWHALALLTIAGSVAVTYETVLTPDSSIPEMVQVFFQSTLGLTQTQTGVALVIGFSAFAGVSIGLLWLYFAFPVLLIRWGLDFLKHKELESETGDVE